MRERYYNKVSSGWQIAGCCFFVGVQLRNGNIRRFLISDRPWETPHNSHLTA